MIASLVSVSVVGLIAATYPALRLGRRREWVEPSLHRRYLDKAAASFAENDSDWTYRCQDRAHEALSYRRWTDSVGVEPLAAWELALLTVGLGATLVGLVGAVNFAL